MKYLTNTWYVAAWSSEIDQGPVGRSILEDRVALYRTEDGEAVALGGVCPHRLAPLHRGKIKGRGLQCPYHGLQFEPSGKCAHNPHGPLDAAASVRAYPVLEQSGLVWIWMGDRPADPALMPSFPILSDPTIKWVRGFLEVAGNYQLVIDNLLDLSHVQYLHPNLSSQGASGEGAQRKTTLSDDGITQTNRIARAAIPRSKAPLWPDAPAEVQLASTTWWRPPSNIFLDVGVTYIDGDPAAPVVRTPSVHLITPSQSGSSYYFWMHGRNVDLDNEELDRTMYSSLNSAFVDEDEPMIAAIQEVLGDSELMDQSRVSFQTDTAAIQARRIVSRLIAAD